MYLAHTLKYSTASGALRNLRVTSLMTMSNGLNFHTSAFLKAADAEPFSAMQGILHPSLLKGLDDMGFANMTPVQSKVLGGLRPLKRDCLVQAKTGTGKTIAFLLPAIQSLLQSSPPLGHVSILILSPTRELALQIAAEAARLLACFTSPIEVHTAFGGVGLVPTLARFKRGDPKILVATPGRLSYYLGEPDVRLKFQSMQTLILDEADAMLDIGFLPEILSIIDQLPSKREKRWQGMCFSATVPDKIKKVLPKVLNEDYTMISTVDSSEPPTLAGVEQNFIVIPTVKDTFNALFALISLETSESKESPKIIVFGTVAKLVALYVRLFQEQTRLKVYELHSRLSQSNRIRITAEFKQADRGILFATDVVGRGMDFPNVTLVVQVGLPISSDAYTHRVGRTARAGKDGRAIILLTEAESYFIHANRKFPITNYPGSGDVLQDKAAASKVSQAMESIEQETKTKAYIAYLGFMKSVVKNLKTDNAGLVQIANELALKGMKLTETPEVESRVVGKMGLKGVAGLRVTKSKRPG